LELYDEVWRHMKDQQMMDMLLATNATARKYRGGMMLSTQSPLQLGDYAHLIRTNCPDAIFMGGSFNPKEYGVFQLNERQLELISSLEAGEFLLTRKKYSKVCRLSVDEQSRWLYSTDPNDRVKRNKAIEEFGREEAFRHLVAMSTAK
jgi:type IV secretory pathway VirB4 component